jgi:UDP-2,3-diacylglucosamine hydrolase
LQITKKIFFVSDHHFGAPTNEASLPREKRFIAWLDSIENELEELFILGDLFDFWFEYKHVVPKGFVRVLGRLANLSDKGIKIHFFVGNHDLWMKDYLQKELGINVYFKPKEFTYNNKTFLIGHGDGLGPHDKGYKRMKKVFTNPVAKFFFKWFHPDLGVGLAKYLSVKNKLISGDEDVQFLGEDKEWLVQYCKRKLASKHYDFFLFGHRHLPMDITLNTKSKYINTGDWIVHFTYAVFDGNTLSLKKAPNS